MKLFVLSGFLFTFAVQITAQTADFTRYVNPFIVGGLPSFRFRGSKKSFRADDWSRRSFEKETSVKISAPEAAARIFYTPDGTEASEKSTQYTQPLTVAETSGVKAISVGKAGRASFAAESRLNRMPHDWDVKLFSVYNRQYTGDGVEGLIDGLCGTTNFASGEWQGCQAQDFVTVIDLQRETEIEKLGAGFLQVARSRIRMSTRIEFEISGDNENFRQAAEIKSDVAAEDMEHKIRDYVQNIAPARARYVWIKAFNLGKIPAWHPGAGFDALIFVDEIFIE